MGQLNLCVETIHSFKGINTLDESRQNIRPHSWSVFSVFIVCISLNYHVYFLYLPGGITLSRLRIYHYKIYFEDVSYESDEFRVNTHICKLRCWYL